MADLPLDCRRFEFNVFYSYYNIMNLKIRIMLFQSVDNFADELFRGRSTGAEADTCLAFQHIPWHFGNIINQISLFGAGFQCNFLQLT